MDARNVGLHWLTRFWLNEAEGGREPVIDKNDTTLIGIGYMPHNHYLPYIDSGVHPTSSMFANREGQAAEGIGSMQPSVIGDYWYFGEAPTSLQPVIDKPNPWS